MAAGDLSTRDVVRAHGALGTGTGVDTLLDRLVTASSQIFKSLTSRRISRAVFTENYDGDRAGTGRTELWLRDYPVNSVSSLKENGITLTVGTGYDTTKDAILDPVRGTLIRQNVAGWAPGRQNIEVTSNRGWDYPRVGTGGIAPWLETDLPFDIEQAVTELTILLFKERDRIGEGGKVFEKWTTTYIRKLNPYIAEVIDNYTREGGMRC